MDLNINIDAAAVEKSVTEAIIKSCIGPAIESALRERLSDFRLRDTIGKVIDQQIAVIVRDLLLKEETGSKMKEAVKSHLSDEMLKVIVGKACDKIWS